MNIKTFENISGSEKLAQRLFLDELEEKVKNQQLEILNENWYSTLEEALETLEETYNYVLKSPGLHNYKNFEVAIKKAIKAWADVSEFRKKLFELASFSVRSEIKEAIINNNSNRYITLLEIAYSMEIYVEDLKKT